MPSVQILIDSSFLYALFDRDDAKHQQALNWAARQNADLIGLQVVAGNTPAVSLYQRLGFVVGATNSFWLGTPADG